MSRLRIEGTEEGDSPPEVQKWIPTPSPPKKRIRNRHSEISLTFMALKDYMNRGILKVYDDKGGRIVAPGDHFKLAKILPGKLLIVGDSEASGEVLTSMVKDWIKEWKRAWKRVDGHGASIGLIDLVGQKGSRHTRDQVERFTGNDDDLLDFIK